MSLFRLNNKYENLIKIKSNNNKFLANEICRTIFGGSEVEEKENKKISPPTEREIKKFDDFKKNKKNILSLFEDNKKVYKKFLEEL